MTSIELKRTLMERISIIDDISFLNAIKVILDTKTESQIIALSKDQIKEIEESKKQIHAGKYIIQDEMDNDFEKWLNEK